METESTGTDLLTTLSKAVQSVGCIRNELSSVQFHKNSESPCGTTAVKLPQPASSMLAEVAKDATVCMVALKEPASKGQCWPALSVAQVPPGSQLGSQLESQSDATDMSGSPGSRVQSAMQGFTGERQASPKAPGDGLMSPDSEASTSLSALLLQIRQRSAGKEARHTTSITDIHYPAFCIVDIKALRRLGFPQLTFTAHRHGVMNNAQLHPACVTPHLHNIRPRNRGVQAGR
ncbi:hypothetical protein HaLaN_22025 [Haematococcus lacustris]|uniref:Uncharacterized protein n=1 Tax=Haematococcus lacustris TaxID=44745 RepID=A0A699ZZK8_HAELA|nr:hypothetical protein HaLaN_22025 [Haematococcus lacustris]